jgi:hypothetical protein
MELTCSEHSTDDRRSTLGRFNQADMWHKQWQPPAFYILRDLRRIWDPAVGFRLATNPLEASPPADSIILKKPLSFRRVVRPSIHDQLLSTQHNHLTTRQDTRTGGRILLNNPTTHAKLDKTKYAWRQGYANTMSTSRASNLSFTNDTANLQERLAARPAVRQAIPARRKSRTRQRPACRYVLLAAKPNDASNPTSYISNSSPAVVSSVSSSRTRRTRCALPQRPPCTSLPSSNT